VNHGHHTIVEQTKRHEALFSVVGTIIVITVPANIASQPTKSIPCLPFWFVPLDFHCSYKRVG
jgi:hypothetical protein